MKRVVISGYGILSSIGVHREAVRTSLRAGTSGISYFDEYLERGFRTNVLGDIEVDLKERVPRKILRFMGESAAYSYLAMEEAIAHAGLAPEDISNPRTGIVMGIGGSSTKDIFEAFETYSTKSARRVGPYYVPRTMASANAANLATSFKILGTNYCLSSACATSAHCIGHAMELIQLGKQDIVFAGGGEEIFWSGTLMFDAMGALSSKFNDRPETSSRPYDRDRDGFVISGGAGVMVVESLEHAQARGGTILAELVGYGATSDGHDMVAPGGGGAVRCVDMAMDMAGGRKLDYINTHGTSTPAGDLVELRAIREALGENLPPISSTKSTTGHALGAAGVNEAIYGLMMMEDGFIAPSKNIENLDPEAADFPIQQEVLEGQSVDTVLSNSFGFGGTNACLIFSKPD